jgi:radical SAM superfamily enzyme YgiQ (UPF0313 family)
VRALLISTYDLGRQPFGLASPAAWLREAGVEVTCSDLSRERLPEDAVRASDFIAFFLPMHTATRLALPVIDRVRALNPDAQLCAYGLYASLNAALIKSHGVRQTLSGEFEEALRDLIVSGRDPAPSSLPRLRFRTPDRSGLPPLSRYASLQIGSDKRTTGYTEASRGCKHRCRHCPIVPVYDGLFRVVPVSTVIADVRLQVEAGAQHITFGDPDFFNGIGHAKAVVDAFGLEFPGVSYDVTIKVEHLLQHADVLPSLRDTGCAFVTSAVESIDDGVLARLEKGHTRADFERVVGLFQGNGLVLAPTFVAFTPWTTLEGYCELLEVIDWLDLIDHIAPIQLAIRLLVTQGSRLFDLEDVRRLCGTFDPRSLTFPWKHDDSSVDALQEAIASAVGARQATSRREMFALIWRMAHDAASRPTALPATRSVRPRTSVPYLNEPWYC